MNRFDPLLILIDCQTTGANPSQGQMLEIGFASPEGRVGSFLIEQNPTTSTSTITTIPRRISQLTGIHDDDLSTAVPLAKALGHIQQEFPHAEYALIHYARFEIAFLKNAFLPAPIPWKIFCSYELCRRLLPQLPSKGLKPVAGYFGAKIEELKRSSHHVSATQTIWRYLKPLLIQRGLCSIEEVIDWLAATKVPKNIVRTTTITRQERLSLPSQAGVYRFVNASNQVLYVGKATNLRQRVNTYFGKRVRSHQKAFLTQARRIDYTITATEVEAALLETDLIKRYDPPYNIALKERQRQVFFMDRQFTEISKTSCNRFCFGPFAHPEPFDHLNSLQRAISRSQQLDLKFFWGIEDEEIAKSGLTQFKSLLGERSLSNRQLMAHGLCWVRHRQKQKLAEEAGEVDLDSECLKEENTPDNPDKEPNAKHWTPERVLQRLIGICCAAARAYLHGRDVAQLNHCHMSWSAESGLHRLTVQNGQVKTYDATNALGIELVHDAYDIAAYDRIRTLRTEIKRLRQKQRLNNLQTASGTPLYLDY